MPKNKKPTAAAVAHDDVVALANAQWQAFRSQLNGFPVDLDGGRGFVLIDLTNQQPEAHLLAVRGPDQDGSRVVVSRRRFADRSDLRHVLGGDLTMRSLKRLCEVLAADKAGHVRLSDGLADFGLLPATGAQAAGRFYAGLADRFFAGLPRARDIESLLPRQAVAAKLERHLSKAGLDQVAGLLDREALEALAAGGPFDAVAYGFYAGSGSSRISHSDAVSRRERRLVAARLYPAIASLYPRRPGLRLAIDRVNEPVVQEGETRQEALARELRAPLNAALKEQFGLSKGVFKLLEGMDRPLGDVDVEKLPRRLTEVPVDWLPKQPEQWEAYLDVSESLTVLSEITGHTFAKLADGCKGDWCKLRLNLARAAVDRRPPEGTVEAEEERLKQEIDWKKLSKAEPDELPALAASEVARVGAPEGVPAAEVERWLVNLYAPDTGRGRLVNDATDVYDMVRSFADRVVLPIGANASEEPDLLLTEAVKAEAARVAAGVLFSGKAAVAIVEASRHWHSQEHNIATAAEVELARARGRGEWPEFIPSVRAPNGVAIVPSVSQADLREETDRMHHCVGTGGYGARCRKGAISILFARIYDDNGQLVERLSTNEVEVPGPGIQELRSRQHRGPHNQTPDPRAVDAFVWLAEEIRSGRIQINHAGFSALRDGRAEVARTDEVVALCGYDWRSREKIYEAMKPWGRYVAKKYRSMDVDAFAETQDIQQIARRIACLDLAPVA